MNEVRLSRDEAVKELSLLAEVKQTFVRGLMRPSTYSGQPRPLAEWPTRYRVAASPVQRTYAACPRYIEGEWVGSLRTFDSPGWRDEGPRAKGQNQGPSHYATYQQPVPERPKAKVQRAKVERPKPFTFTEAQRPSPGVVSLSDGDLMRMLGIGSIGNVE